jgi:hypothetical protein
MWCRHLAVGGVHTRSTPFHLLGVFFVPYCMCPHIGLRAGRAKGEHATRTKEYGLPVALVDDAHWSEGT